MNRCIYEHLNLNRESTKTHLYKLKHFALLEIDPVHITGQKTPHRASQFTLLVLTSGGKLPYGGGGSVFRAFFGEAAGEDALADAFELSGGMLYERFELLALNGGSMLKADALGPTLGSGGGLTKPA